MRSIILTALLTLVTLSGCLDGTEETDPLAGDPVGSLLDQTQWVLGPNGTLPLDAFGHELPSFDLIHVTNRISGEPTLGVTRTGAVFYASIDFDQAGGALPRTVYYRSVDDGASWEDYGPHVAYTVNTHPTSFDPYVYTDPSTGRVFAMDMGPHVACNKVSWSDDDGVTWVTREGACPLPVADHPSLFAGPKVGPLGAAAPATGAGGYPNNVYLCSNQIADVQCSLSPDGGITWLPSQPVFMGVDVGEFTEDPQSLDWLCGALTGHGHASFVDGTVFVGRGYCGVPMVATSHDGGLNWNQVVISGDPDHYIGYEHDVSIGTDLAGNAYAFWAGMQDSRVYLSVSQDQGRTWSEPRDVTAPGVTAVKLPSLVAGDEGRIAFQYIGSTTPSGWGIHFNETLEDELRNATWNAYVGISLDAHTADYTVATTMVNDPAKPLKRGDCWDRCHGDDGGLYDFLDLDMDPMTGTLWSALVDVCTGECDRPGADAETHQKAMGTVARQVGGPRLLSQPFPEA